jgi:transposase
VAGPGAARGGASGHPGPKLTLEQTRAKRGLLRDLEPLIVAAYLDGITFERMACILASRGVSVGQDTLKRVLRRHGYEGKDANANNIEFWTSKFQKILDEVSSPHGEQRRP